MNYNQTIVNLDRINYSPALNEKILEIIELEKNSLHKKDEILNLRKEIETDIRMLVPCVNLQNDVYNELSKPKGKRNLFCGFKGKVRHD